MNTQSVNKRILDFIQDHHVLTLATQSELGVWCASCFYFYDAAANEFIFTSDLDTRHGQEMLERPEVAGAIVLETSMVGKIRGLQFTGRVQLLEGEDHKAARAKYIKQFPIAAVARLNLWRLKPGHFKLTDNRLGFGKKLIWNA